MPEQVGGNHYFKAGAKCPSCQGAIMHWDYAAGLPYLDAQISKYIDRHQDKGGFQDMLKALTYWEKAVQHYYPEEYKAWLAEKQLASVNKPLHFEYPIPMWPPHAFEPGPVRCRKCNLDFVEGGHSAFVTVRATYPDGRPLNDGASDGNSIYDPPGEVKFFDDIDKVKPVSHHYVNDECTECGDRVRPFPEQMEYLNVEFKGCPGVRSGPLYVEEEAQQLPNQACVLVDTAEAIPDPMPVAETQWTLHKFDMAPDSYDCDTCGLSQAAGNHSLPEYRYDPISCPMHNYDNNTCTLCGNKRSKGLKKSQH